MATYRTILTVLVGLLPMILLAQPMRTVRLDFPPSALGDADEREVRIDNLPVNGTFVIIDTCDAPFRVTTPVDQLIAQNGVLRVRCEFLPTRPGSFRDELILEHRPSGPPAERIRIRLNGTGFRIERTDRIEFGDVLIGDSTQKMILVRDNILRDIRWSITQAPSAPFSTPDQTAPYRPGRDTIGFRFSYAPTVVGRSIDTIGLIRTYIPTGEALDTFMVILDGTAVSMKNADSVMFTSMTPGMTITSDLVEQLPASPKTREFRYSLIPRTTGGVVTGLLTDPTAASRTRVIVMTYTARPQTYRSVREQFVLQRTRIDGRVLDSTIITAVVTMVPQPIQLRASFTSDTLVHRIGDTVVFDIVVQSAVPLDQPVLLNDLVAECAINGTVLVPITNDQVSMITRDDRTYVRIAAPGPVTVSASGDVLMRWSAIVVLGDAAFSPLALTPVTATLSGGAPITLESGSSVMRVSNVWIMPDGTPRLVNPRASQLQLTVAPNPVVSVGTISIGNVPSGTGRLEIVDPRGILVSDLTQQVRTGTRAFSVGTTGSVDIVVQPGVYYARLSAQLSPSEPLSSVVRPFVIR